jgi:hypothetical protein
MNKKVGLIIFGDIEEPKNGYNIRCNLIVKKILSEGDSVVVFQFSKNMAVSSNDKLRIISLPVAHEKPKKRNDLIVKFFSLNPFSEIFFQIESYYRLKKYRDELRGFDEFIIGGCLLISSFILVKQLNKKIILDTHCINTDLSIKFKARSFFIGSIREAVWNIIERNILSRVDKIIVSSMREIDFVVKYFGLEKTIIEVIENEVISANSEKFTPQAIFLKKSMPIGKKIALFIGDLGAIQNIIAEKFIRNELAPFTPNIQYIVVGNNPSKNKNKNNIVYTGFVPDIDPYILMSDICIAPLSVGSGTKTKMLDYLKYGKKIIATPIGVEGITPSTNTYICELDNFKNKISELL